MTTRDVYGRHLRNELDGDLDTILSDYASDAIVATADGIGSGHDYIRQSYERLLPIITSTEPTSSIQVLGDVLYLTFRAHHNGRDELIATDTFVIRDDSSRCTPSTPPDRARRLTSTREGGARFLVVRDTYIRETRDRARVSAGAGVPTRRPSFVTSPNQGE